MLTLLYYKTSQDDALEDLWPRREWLPNLLCRGAKRNIFIVFSPLYCSCCGLKLSYKVDASLLSMSYPFLLGEWVVPAKTEKNTTL